MYNHVLNDIKMIKSFLILDLRNFYMEVTNYKQSSERFLLCDELNSLRSVCDSCADFQHFYSSIRDIIFKCLDMNPIAEDIILQSLQKLDKVLKIQVESFDMGSKSLLEVIFYCLDSNCSLGLIKAALCVLNSCLSSDFIEDTSLFKDNIFFDHLFNLFDVYINNLNNFSCEVAICINIILLKSHELIMIYSSSDLLIKIAPKIEKIALLMELIENHTKEKILLLQKLLISFYSLLCYYPDVLNEEGYSATISSYFKSILDINDSDLSSLLIHSFIRISNLNEQFPLYLLEHKFASILWNCNSASISNDYGNLLSLMFDSANANSPYYCTELELIDTELLCSIILSDNNFNSGLVGLITMLQMKMQMQRVIIDQYIINNIFCHILKLLNICNHQQKIVFIRFMLSAYIPGELDSILQSSEQFEEIILIIFHDPSTLLVALDLVAKYNSLVPATESGLLSQIIQNIPKFFDDVAASFPSKVVEKIGMWL